jgi:uncharacterized protein
MGRLNERHVESGEAIKALLTASKTVAVVGLSPDETKPSNQVARYLKERGYRIIPVNPGQDTILGEKAFKSLIDIPEKVDIVDIFIRSENVLPFISEAIKLKPRAIWLQLGIRNDEAKAAVGKTDVAFVMDKCIKQEHSRLFAAS